MKILSVLALFLSVSAFAGPKTVKISLGTGTAKNKEEMVFRPAKLTVKAGSHVVLTFKNNGSSKGITHNFVLVKPGTAQTVLDASIAAGPDKNWIADSTDVLAKGNLVDAGQSETIDFTAPTAPGEYPYVCTFPGHTTMRGMMTIKK